MNKSALLGRKYSAMLVYVVIALLFTPIYTILGTDNQSNSKCLDRSALVAINVINQFCLLNELNDLIQMKRDEINMCCSVVDSLTTKQLCIEATNSTVLVANWDLICKLPGFQEQNNDDNNNINNNNQRYQEDQEQKSSGIEVNSQSKVSEDQTYTVQSLDISQMESLEVDPQLEVQSTNGQQYDEEQSQQGGVVAFRSAKLDIDDPSQTTTTNTFTGTTTVLTPPTTPQLPPNKWQTIIQEMRAMQGLTFSAWFLSKLDLIVPDTQQVTILAPVDDAYQELCRHLNISLFDLEKLFNWEEILKLHVALGAIPVLEIVDRGTWLGTLQGSSLWVQRSILTGQVVMVGCCDPENLARVIKPDESLKDGSIVHIIDNVILSQGSAFNKQSVVLKNNN